MITDPKFRLLLATVAASTAAHQRAETVRRDAFAAYEHRAHMIQAERDAATTAQELARAEHALCQYLVAQQADGDRAGSY